jgi:hypothetical protein
VTAQALKHHLQSWRQKQVTDICARMNALSVKQISVLTVGMRMPSLPGECRTPKSDLTRIGKFEVIIDIRT